MELIRNQSIRILESEGIGPAINALADLLASDDGLAKHGPRAWSNHCQMYHYEKAVRHMCSAPYERVDSDSGHLALVHAMARIAFLIMQDEGDPDGPDRD